MSRNRGFTLIELMVTVVLSFVIVGAVYALYAQSVSAYRVEGQTLDMQDRLRFGLEHMKRDLRRSGFLATPNSAVDESVCPAPDYELRAITITTDPYLSQVHRPLENVEVQPSTVTLFGDFFSGRVYRTSGIQGNQVTLQADGLPESEVEFNQIFNPYPGTPSRYLRVVTPSQFEFYLPITAADFATRSVTLQNSAPTASDGTLCGVTGFGEGLEVNVAGFIRYRILFDTRPDAETGKTDLVREELQVDGQTVVPNSQLVIADYAIDLQFYDFGFDMDSVGNSPSFVQYGVVDQVADEMGNGLLGKDGKVSLPHRLRYLTIKVTVRASSEDPDYAFRQREDVYAPLTHFDLDEMAGSCRTSTLASRVELTSLAVRNLVGN